MGAHVIIPVSNNYANVQDFVNAAQKAGSLQSFSGADAYKFQVSRGPANKLYLVNKSQSVTGK